MNLEHLSAGKKSMVHLFEDGVYYKKAWYAK